jgi:short-subunit dehydrogenase
MRDFAGKRYWLVGASEGLGASLAKKLGDAGAELILSARNAERLGEIASRMSTSVEVLPVDVTDQAAVEQAAETVGRIDGIVYLSAAYWPMHTTDWNTVQAAQMIDVNLTGAMRVVGAVLPKFLAKGHGHIVFTGSLAAFRGLPASVGYSASKAAMVSLAETMRLDLKDTGVEVQIAHPGFIRTRLTDKNDFKMPSIMEPDEAANHMFRAMQGRRFATSFPGVFALIMRGLQLFPNWLYFKVFA